MNNRIVDGTEVEISSGNVFADLELPDAPKLKIKSSLVIEITKAVRKMGLSQDDAAHRMGISQAKVSGLLRGDFANLSERKLMDCLNRLGAAVEIKRTSGSAQVGTVFLQRVVIDQASPLKLKVPNDETLAAMQESRAMMAARRARFTTANELFDDLQKNIRE
jgi:predicted XRE-type DNA-binding protein